MTQYIQKKHCDATEIDGEWIILNTEDYTVTKINEVGGYCWSLLHEVQTVDSLSEQLSYQYSDVTSLDQLRSDVEDFLTKLSSCGLITNVD